MYVALSFVFVALQSFCGFPRIVDVFLSVLVCNPDLFSPNRFMTFEPRYKLKSQKILSSEENSKRKGPNQMAKSKAQTHQTNGKQLSYS